MMFSLDRPCGRCPNRVMLMTSTSLTGKVCDFGRLSMLLSISVLLLAGAFAAYLCSKVRVPRIVGMLLVGILIGPQVLNVLSPSLLAISADIRKIALVIILIRAGLSLDLKDLKAVGRPSVLLAFLPATFEILGFVLLAPKLLGVSRMDAALMGAVLCAVSPAVVVPKMVSLIDRKLGTNKSIPQMILAGASLDDVYAIVVFTAILGLEQGQKISFMTIASVPISIVTGIGFGVLIGLCLSKLFEHAQKMGNLMKVLVIFATGLLVTAFEDLLPASVPFSGLLAVMSMCCIIGMRCPVDKRSVLSGQFSRIWMFGEIFLFVLLGAAVNISATVNVGPIAIAVILLALVVRSVGSALCVLGTNLNGKERLFCVFAYLPKATVQAAIGGIPLALGLGCGDIVLSVSVLSILITAPLGAFAMDLTEKRFLS